MVLNGGGAHCYRCALQHDEPAASRASCDIDLEPETSLREIIDQTSKVEHFSRLPAELIDQIVSFLSCPDILAFRQVNRYVEHASFDHFAHTFFRKRGFLVTTESLNVLREISQHAGLRKHVQHVWFNPDCFTFVSNPFRLVSEAADVSSIDYETESRAVLFDTYANDHFNLLHSLELQDLLTNIFNGLPMLKTLGMRRGEHHNAYGWQRIYNQLQHDPRWLGYDSKLYTTGLSDTTYLFIAIIKALAASNTRLRRLYTDAVQVDHINVDLQPSGVEYDEALRSVEFFEVNVTGLLDKDDVEQATPLPRSRQGQALQTILQSMPRLLDLSMTIFKDPKQRHMIPPEPSQPLSWYNTYPFEAFQRISNNVRLQDIRRFKLEKLCTTSAMLTNFLRSCAPVLMSLKLREIHFLVKDPTGPDPWITFFRFIRDECHMLEYLLLHALSYNGVSMQFTRRPWPRIGSRILREVPVIEVVGHEDIRERLSALVQDDVDGVHVRSQGYELDDNIWYTDTSDEDW